MLRRTSLWLDSTDLKRLESVGRKMGGLKTAQVIRLAIRKFLDKERTEAK